MVACKAQRSSEVVTGSGVGSATGGWGRSAFRGDSMEDLNVYGYCPDGTPITPEIGREIRDVLHAIGWIGVLASSRLWATLRRIPPKAFLLELIDAYLVYARSSRHYVNVPKGQPRPDLTLRSAPAERLRNLLFAWEPPLITTEIRDAALAVALAEFGEPPAENWDDAEHDVPIPLEASLIWPEGAWDENAFVTARVDNKAQSEP